MIVLTGTETQALHWIKDAGHQLQLTAFNASSVHRHACSSRRERVLRSCTMVLYEVSVIFACIRLLKRCFHSGSAGE